MPKITLEDATSGYRSNVTYNANNASIEEALNDRVLYRDNVGTEPNYMLNDLDMNGYSIINHFSDGSAGSLVTFEDLQNLTSTIDTSPVLEEIATAQIFSEDNTSDVTPTLDYAYGYVRFTGSSPVSFIVPPSSSVNFIIGTEIHIRQAGTGLVTVVQGSGVTVNAPFSGTLVLAGQGATITIKKVAADEWDLMGQVFSS